MCNNSFLIQCSLYDYMFVVTSYVCGIYSIRKTINLFTHMHSLIKVIYKDINNIKDTDHEIFNTCTIGILSNTSMMACTMYTNCIFIDKYILKYWTLFYDKTEKKCKYLFRKIQKNVSLIFDSCHTVVYCILLTTVVNVLYYLPWSV